VVRIYTNRQEPEAALDAACFVLANEETLKGTPAENIDLYHLRGMCETIIKSCGMRCDLDYLIESYKSND